MIRSSPKIRLLIDCRWIRLSGVGTCIYNIVSRIYLESDILTTLLCLRADEEIISGLSFKYDVIWTNIRSMSLAEQVVLPFTIPHRFDYFYAPVYIRPILHPGRLLCTIHDILHVTRPQFTSNPLLRLYAYILTATALLRAKQITVDTQFTFDEITRFFPWVRSSRLLVLCPGFKIIETSSVETQAANLDDNLSVSKPFFLFVGNLKPHKNLKTLIEAFLGSESRFTHQLRVVGKAKGFLTPSLDKHIESARGSDAIVFEGNINEKRLAKLYKHAVALVFPSYYEGFGLPPLEALSVGTCVIASLAPPMPEVIGDYALYFEPNDVKTLTCLLDFSVKNQCSLESRLYATKSLSWLEDKYSWSSYVSKLVSFMRT